MLHTQECRDTAVYLPMYHTLHRCDSTQYHTMQSHNPVVYHTVLRGDEQFVYITLCLATVGISMSLLTSKTNKSFYDLIKTSLHTVIHTVYV